ncbi:MAG: ATP-grasp domain-containing protein [Coriobacteriia bacterium]|nr:ATP-grasp domain-containing protein [Coriobacteriia bacterium]
MALKVGNSDFIPLIFAADINVYSLARAFHEQYGIVSAGYGMAAAGPINHTSIIDYTPVERADQPDVLPGLVTDFAQKHSDQKILVFGCGDNYVQRISMARHDFPDNVIAPYVEYDDIYRLASKQSFYTLCDRYGIEHPATFVYREQMGGQLELDFDAPYIVKPTSSVTWWENAFEGQRKVHLVHDINELKTLLSTIYAHGYPDEMIIQEYIPGGDSNLHVLTQYFDGHGVLRMSGAGRVLLEEHTAHGIGNSAVIVSEDLPELPEQLAGLMTGEGFRGFACFDIKYDHRDGRYKVFEVNTRQGRGHYYVTGSGLNVARFVVEDLVYGRQLEPELSIREPFLWHVTPASVARQVAEEAGLLEHIDYLLRNNRSGNPLDYHADRNVKRSLWLAKYTRQQHLRYQEYKQGGALV